MKQLHHASRLFLLCLLAAAAVLAGCDSGGLDTGEGGEEPDPPTVRFAEAGATVNEGDSTATIAVEITAASDASVRVEVAFDEEASEGVLADVEDYATESVTFPAGAADGTTRDVTVLLTDDDEAESTETVVFALRNATGGAEIAAPETFVLDIEDNDEGENGDFTPVEVTALDCPAELETGQEGTFTATINEDEATAPVSSTWDFGDDTDATGLEVTKSYDATGTYEITFTASNADGDGNEHTDSATCTTEVVAPAAGATIASVNASPNPSDVGESVSFTAEVEGDEPIDCEWDFGDGATATGCEASHTYDEAGSYTVTLTASNDAGEDTAALTQEVESSTQGNVLFVDADATGADNGTSWSNAFPNLQAALRAAEAGQEIWVAEGTYYPDQGQAGGDRSATFQLISDVALYGGFSGTERSRSERNADPASNGTVLSGDIGTADFSNDNSYHVVTGSGTDRSAVLDGFTVTAGRADAYRDEVGAGMRNIDGSPTVRNVIFSSNRASENGAGMYNVRGNPLVLDVVFRNNVASGRGGGMYNSQSSPTLEEVLFESNTAGVGGGLRNNENSNPSLSDVVFRENNATYGGGIANADNSSPVIVRTLFLENEVSQEGGGMYNEQSSPRIIAVRFIGNSARRSGGGVYNDGSSTSPVFTNVLFSGNNASRNGGGMYNDHAYPALFNTTFSGNTASDFGGGMSVYSVDDDTQVLIRNSIFWGNTATRGGNQIHLSSSTNAVLIAHSLIEGGLPSGAVNDEGEILDADPLFVDADGPDNIIGTVDDNARLQNGSPAINAGSNAALPRDEQDLDNDGDTAEPLPLDLDGDPRVQGGMVDMGAYEGGN